MRHPFERLVSAFRHKSFQNMYGLGKLTFQQFLQEKVVGVCPLVSHDNLSLN